MRSLSSFVDRHARTFTAIAYDQGFTSHTNFYKRALSPTHTDIVIVGPDKTYAGAVPNQRPEIVDYLHAQTKLLPNPSCLPEVIRDYLPVATSIATLSLCLGYEGIHEAGEEFTTSLKLFLVTVASSLATLDFSMFQSKSIEDTKETLDRLFNCKSTTPYDEGFLLACLSMCPEQKLLNI